jgi:hypothetical protein
MNTASYRLSGKIAWYCFALCLLFTIAPNEATGQVCTPISGEPGTPMVNHCGLILSASQTTHIIAIDPNGNSIPGFYKSYLQQYLQDVGDTPYVGMVEEYGGSGHSYYGGIWSLTEAAPAGLHYTDSGAVNLPGDVSSYLEQALFANPSWNVGPSGEYFVLLPPSATAKTAEPLGLCVGPDSFCGTNQGACGYHHWFDSPSRGARIYYAVIQYGCDWHVGVGPSGDTLFMTGSAITVAHEQLEMITDPEGTGWWQDTTPQGGEVMDKCAGDADWGQQADGSNLVLHGHPYVLPKMWSNLRNTCLRPGRYIPVKNATQEIGINSDGRLEIFGLGLDSQVWHNYQVAPNSGWSGWYGLPAPWGWSVQPVVGTNSDGRLELFEVGPDHQMYHLWQAVPSGGPWDGGSLGGWFQEMIPAVATNADGRLEVFGVGGDGQVWHSWQTVPNGGWSGWSSLNLPGSVSPSVGTNADGRLEIFVIGPDHAMWHLWQTVPSGGPWNGESLGGWFQDMIPAVATNADGRLEVFGVGGDGQVWHSWQTVPNGGWSGWTSIVAPWSWSLPPRIGINADGRLELFMIGPDNAIWHLWQNAPSSSTSWSGASLGGGFRLMAPAVRTNQDGRLEVFGIGQDGAMWHNWQVVPNGGWSGWYSLGGGFTQM